MVPGARSFVRSPLANLHLIRRLQLHLWRLDIGRRNSVRAKLVADKLVANAPRVHTACGKYERLAAISTAQCLTGHRSSPTRNRHSRPQPTIAFDVPHQQVQRIGSAHQKPAVGTTSALFLRIREHRSRRNGVPGVLPTKLLLLRDNERCYPGQSCLCQGGLTPNLEMR
jgi:hypothetical protein